VLVLKNSRSHSFPKGLIETPTGDTGIVRAVVQFSSTVPVLLRPTLKDLNPLHSTLKLFDGAGTIPI
jgi:hypothetical protein